MIHQKVCSQLYQPISFQISTVKSPTPLFLTYSPTYAYIYMIYTIIKVCVFECAQHEMYTYNVPQYIVWSWCTHIYSHSKRYVRSIFAIWLIDFLPCVSQVPLFENTEIGFTKLLALSIKPVLFLKNEYIVRKGDIGSEVGLELHRTPTHLEVFRALLYKATQVCLCVGQALPIYTCRCSLSIVEQLRLSLRMAMSYLPPWQKESSLGRSV